LIGNLAFVNKSALQGLVRFREFVMIGLFENSLKLLLGVLFVWIGWSVLLKIESVMASEECSVL
jgi:hypothetical protein